MNSSRTRITGFQMAVMTTITIASLRSLPAMAVMGWSSIILCLIPATVFFVPVSLVSAELAAAVPGSIYEWVKAGLGRRWALVAGWVLWAQNVVWFPAQLAMIAAAGAYFANRGDLAGSGGYTAAVIVLVYWAAVWVGSRGGNLFAKVASRAGLVGTLIPAGILVFLAIIWLATGHHEPGNALEQTNLLPHMSGPASIALIVSNFLAFAGMEMNAVHASHLDDPRRGYTKVIGIAFAGTMAIFLVPTLAMALVLPPDPGHISDGVMVTFATYFHAFGVDWLGNIVYLVIAFGGLASVVTWNSGPSRILYHAANDGALPPFFKKTNANDAQVGILVLMGIIVTILASLYIIFPENVSDVFSVLIAMTAALYLIMYVFMFVSAMIIRARGQSGNPGQYRVPALKLVAVVGTLASLAALAMSFVPQEGQEGIPPAVYPVLVAAFIVGITVPGLVLYRIARKQAVLGVPSL